MCQKLLGTRDKAVNLHILFEFSFRGQSYNYQIMGEIWLNLCLVFIGIMLLTTEQLANDT